MDALAIARAVSAELTGRGASGVVLTGSHARGDAHAWSDVDLVALGTGDSRLRLVEGLLVSESWVTPAEARAAFSDPGAVGWVVPGWRSAQPLADTGGTVAGLKAEAAAWTWESLGDAPIDWLARELPGYGEEVFRLVGHLEAGRFLPASVVRNVLANRMARIVSVHLRLLYETENRLWDLVGDRMDEDWRRAQTGALAITSNDLQASCRSALELFGMTASTIRYALGAEQRAVVDAAIRLATAASRRPRAPAPQPTEGPEKHSRMTSSGRAFWWTERLWQLAAELPVRRIPISDIPELDMDCWFDGGPATCRAVAEHTRRIQEADLAHPVILSAAGHLMDGGHRLAKAWLAGATEVDAVRFDEDPEPDWVEP